MRRLNIGLEEGEHGEGHRAFCEEHEPCIGGEHVTCTVTKRVDGRWRTTQEAAFADMAAMVDLADKHLGKDARSQS